MYVYMIGHQKASRFRLPLVSLDCGRHKHSNQIPFTAVCLESSVAASSGMGNDRPLVLCGQICLLEYATTATDPRYDKKIDWVCEQVGILLLCDG